MTENHWTRLRYGLTILVAVAALYWLYPREAVSPEEREALREGRTIITFWDRHSGHEHAARKALIQEFNESQDEIFVRTVAIGYNATMEKILTSTAGGAPPDVCSIDSPMLAQLAPQGLFLPLDDLMDGSEGFGEEDYYPHCWRMVSFDGSVWGMPVSTDTYCLIWNKAAFRRAGLDPEVPPRTVEELNEFAEKLTIRAADGSIEQMGFLPWLPWDLSLMWGGLFGGDWLDPDHEWATTANNPELIKAFAWQASFTKTGDTETEAPYAIEPERVAAFSRGLGEYMSANNPFYSGRVAMITEGEWQVTFISRFAPGLDWGVAPLPQPEGAPPRAYSASIIVDVVPSTSRHPEEAKKFLRWFNSPRPGGGTSPVADLCQAIHNIPTRMAEAAEDRFSRHPKFSIFVEQLEREEVITYPIMAASQYMIDQIQRQRERVVYGVVTPEEALIEIETMTNRELRRIREIQERHAL